MQENVDFNASSPFEVGWLNFFSRFKCSFLREGASLAGLSDSNEVIGGKEWRFF
jgi:hypothetical protein